MADTATLIEKFESREATVAVIGLGYVGLPLAVVFAEAGFRVVGIDVDEEKVAKVNRGESYIEDVPSEYLRTLIRKREAITTTGDMQNESQYHDNGHLPHGNGQQTEVAGLLSATTDYSVLNQCNAVSICVPTPLRKTGDPDISYVVSAAEQITRHLHQSMVVILESTTYPGTTTEVILSRFMNNGRELNVGEDFFLAYSPERVDPGRKDWTTKNTPKVIGGVTDTCLQVAKAFYRQSIKKLVPVSSTEAAETVKLLENTFRAVNIGLVNELLLMCDRLGLNIWEIIEAAATKPFGFMKFIPGPGLGGHCIPIDPQYLSWKLKTLDYTARFIELASEVNTSMPRYWVQKVQDALNSAKKPVNGSDILVVGVAYKRDVSDVRESPALDIIDLLLDKGAKVQYHDPFVESIQYNEVDLMCVPNLTNALSDADCVVIVTDHSKYEWSHIVQKSRLIVDTRNALS